MTTIRGGRTIWQVVTNFWTIVYLAAVLIDFFAANRYEFLIGPLSALYVGMLTIYAGSKEFDRWYESYEGKRHGERYVIAFTFVMAFLVIGALIAERRYVVHSEIVATYIAVLSILAITLKSKRMHARRKK